MYSNTLLKGSLWFKNQGMNFDLLLLIKIIRKKMIAGPEVARVVNEFETGFIFTKDATHHHEQVPSIQRSFFGDINSLVTVLEEMGNPFLEDSKDFIALDTNDIMPQNVIDSLYSIKTIGQAQYDLYVAERLENS